MSIFKSGKRQLVVKTLSGLEGLLVQELEGLGASDIEPGIRSVKCSGDLGLLYRVNFMSDLAIRVLVPIEHFSAKTTNELYEKAKRLNWNRYMRRDQTFAIDASVHSKFFDHSKFAALRLKDAIADSFRERTGKRPSVDPERPDIRFTLHIDHNRVSVSLDSSGESLHRRGYRVSGAMAPISEVLAAGIIRLAWDENTPLLNPMCGSGTIALEAARMHRRIPAQINRSYFSFLNWENFDRELWSSVKENAIANITSGKAEIIASDIDPRAIEAAEENLRSVGLELPIQLEKKDFFHYKEVRNQTVIMNPPYGERIDQGDMGLFYNNIANHMKHQFQGSTAWLITSNLTAMKQFGLKPTKKFTLYNGPLECRFFRFDLYAGSKKPISPENQ